MHDTAASIPFYTLLRRGSGGYVQFGWASTAMPCQSVGIVPMLL